jgi:hypothetical protein
MKNYTSNDHMTFGGVRGTGCSLLLFNFVTLLLARVGSVYRLTWYPVIHLASK